MNHCTGEGSGAWSARGGMTIVTDGGQGGKCVGLRSSIGELLVISLFNCYCGGTSVAKVAWEGYV